MKGVRGGMTCAAVLLVALLAYAVSAHVHGLAINGDRLFLFVALFAGAWLFGGAVFLVTHRRQR